MPETLVADLRAEPATRVRSAAFYQVRELRSGQTLILLLAEAPDLLMESVDLQLGHRFAWSAAEDRGLWRVEVRLRADLPPRDALDLLTRDHRRLDELLARALRRINAGDAAGARPLLEAFAAGLRRHVEAENRLLAPLLPGGEGVEIMLREHEDLERQLAEVAACFAGEPLPQAQEVEPFMAILSGTLAKHEYREEANVFPLWAAGLAAMPEAQRAELLERASALLSG